jgi:hypothetical protein
MACCTRHALAALTLVAWGVTLLCVGADGQLTMTIHNNTALGLPVVSTVLVKQLDGDIAAIGQLQSAQLLGQVVMPTDTGTVVFSAISDGTVRVWVDDHLILDDAVSTASAPPRTIASWITFPLGYVGTHHTHMCTRSCTQCMNMSTCRAQHLQL